MKELPLPTVLTALTALILSGLCARPSLARDGVEKAIEAVRNANDDERPALVESLIDLGPDALEQVRAARDGARDPELRRVLKRAVTWILAREIVPRFRKGLKSGLTFDGQYSSLKDLGPETLDALLALLEDEAGEPALRLTACRAVADIADDAIVPRLRELHNDILLYPRLREEVGILLGIFGDTHAVEADIARFSRHIDRLVRQARSNRLSRRDRSKNEAKQADAHLDLANLYYRIRHYKKAVESYEAILKLYTRFQRELTRQINEVECRREQESEPVARLALQRWALQIDGQLKSIKRQETLHYYNAACSNTLAGNIERAKEYLRRAIEGEPSHYVNMEKDGDLSKLRSHSSYAEFRKELGKIFEDKSL